MSGRLSIQHSRYFDAWRGGLALVVLFGHVAQVYYGASLKIWGTASISAVMCFIVLSGFFIGKSLERKDWRTFAIARADRILPPFLLCLLLTVMLWALAPIVFVTGDHGFPAPTARPEYSLDGFWQTAFLLNGFLGNTLAANGPLWSLSFEVWYYALAALAAFGRWRWALVIGVLLSALNYNFAILGALWLIGFGLSRRPLGFLDSNIVPAVLLASAMWFVWTGGEWPIALAIGLWFAAHIQRMLRVMPLDLGPIARTGSFSYSLYVTHFPLLLFCFGAGLPSGVAVVVALAFAATIGAWVEGARPFSGLSLIGRVGLPRPAHSNDRS